MKYAVVFEPTSTGYSAYVPDLPGCVATGATRDQVEERIGEAIAFHLKGLRLDHASVPEPSAWTALVEAQPAG